LGYVQQAFSGWWLLYIQRRLHACRKILRGVQLRDHIDKQLDFSAQIVGDNPR
jgi:hypothetical protein